MGKFEGHLIFRSLPHFISYGWVKKYINKPITEGGLGLTDLSIYANSRRIKFVLDVISGETECWKVLSRWYFKTLDKAHGLEYFVLRNDSDKQYKKSKNLSFMKNVYIVFKNSEGTVFKGMNTIWMKSFGKIVTLNTKEIF